MNNKIRVEIAIVIILIMAVIIGGIFLYLSKEKEIKTEAIDQNYKYKQVDVNDFNHDVSSTSQIVSIDDEWNRYTNNKLGFSINIPKKAYLNWEEIAPITVYESGDINTVFVDYAYHRPFDRSGKAGEKVFNSFDSKYKTIRENQLYNQWGIIIKNIDKKELATFIINNFGKGCYLNTIIVKDIESSRLEGCKAAMSAWTFRYSPEKGKLAYWGMGQEVYFCKYKDDCTYGYEGEMSGSFEFIN